jgi:hypothetical protein
MRGSCTDRSSTFFWGRRGVGRPRWLVTPEIASSNLVVPAHDTARGKYRGTADPRMVGSPSSTLGCSTRCTGWVRLSNGKTRVWLTRDRGSIPRGSTDHCDRGNASPHLLCRQGARGSARSLGKREGFGSIPSGGSKTIRGRPMVGRWPLEPAMEVRALPPELSRGSPRGQAPLCKSGNAGSNPAPRSCAPAPAPEAQPEWVAVF